MTDGVSIYQSEPDEAIERLAQLDSTSRPSGPVLVAAVGGEPRAAVPLDGGPAIADPFQPTAELVSLLELRVAQLDGHRPPGRVARLFAALRSRPGVAPGLGARA
jgi:hypothetical protein